MHFKSQQLLNWLDSSLKFIRYYAQRAATVINMNHLFILYLFIVTLFSHLYLGFPSGSSLKTFRLHLLTYSLHVKWKDTYVIEQLS